MTHESHTGLATRLLPPFAIAAAVIAFGLSSLQRYLDPVQFSMICNGLAFGVWVVLTSELYEPRSRTRNWIFAASVALTGLVTFAVADGIVASKDNDRRCLAIELDMLSSRPLRSDGPDLFQALGCRPQSKSSVHALPREKLNTPS